MLSGLLQRTNIVTNTRALQRFKALSSDAEFIAYCEPDTFLADIESQNACAPLLSV